MLSRFRIDPAWHKMLSFCSNVFNVLREAHVKLAALAQGSKITRWECQIDFLSPVGGFATHTSNMKLQEKALFTIYNTNGVVLRSTK